MVRKPEIKIKDSIINKPNMINLKCRMCKKEDIKFTYEGFCVHCYPKRLWLEAPDVLRVYEKELCLRCSRYIDCITEPGGIVGDNKLHVVYRQYTIGKESRHFVTCFALDLRNPNEKCCSYNDPDRYFGQGVENCR